MIKAHVYLLDLEYSFKASVKHSVCVREVQADELFNSPISLETLGPAVRSVNDD